jgi:hypothetical protein
MSKPPGVSLAIEGDLRDFGVPTATTSRSSRAWTLGIFSGEPLRGRRVILGWMTFVFLLSALYVAKGLKRSWGPEDEGTLAQPAERVLQGEVPHLNFDDVYTGGLTYLNAAAFRIFGTNLISMRYMLYIFFLVWVPALYYAASRFATAPVASAVTLLAVVWSVPNYPAAMPSWYNLFFATFGIAVLLRHVEAPSSSSMFIAGLCGGLSFLFKVSGVFYIAGVLLFLIYREQPVEGTTLPRRSNKLYGTFLTIAVLGYEALLLILLRRNFVVTSFGYFFLPGLVIGVAILYQEFRRPAARQSRRFTFVISEVVPFLLGVTIPIILFLIPYALTGSVSEFVRGTFVLPSKRFAYTIANVTKLKLFGGFAADLALVAGVFLAAAKVSRWVRAVVLFGMPVALLLVRKTDLVLRAIWGMIWMSLPIIVIAGTLILLIKVAGKRMDNDRRQKLFLVLSVTANCSLIQFPYTTAEYFCYIAPLVVLALTAVISFLDHPPRLFLAGAFCFSLLFMMLDCTPGWVWNMGQRYCPDIENTRLTIPIARGLRVEAGSASVYEELGRIITQHARGQYIYATPDCPEVYVLYGFRNPTRTLWDFFDDQTERTKRILATVKKRDINLVVLRRQPFASGPVPSDLRDALERDFPNYVVVRHSTTRCAYSPVFEVRWRA